MQYYWLNKKNNSKLIVFFCGWSFDYIPFQRLDYTDNDVLVIYDYSNIALDVNNSLPFGLEFYEKINLVTWSMGVYVAYLLRNRLPKFNKKIAINGTPYPVDDSFGIPEKTFELTLRYVDTGLQGKFQKNLFKRVSDFDSYMLNPVKRTIDNQKTELIALSEFIKNNKIEYSKFYDYAIISDTDKIIPTVNQKRFWNEKAEVKILDSGHFPFFEFKSWDEIIEWN